MKNLTRFLSLSLVLANVGCFEEDSSPFNLIKPGDFIVEAESMVDSDSDSEALVELVDLTDASEGQGIQLLEVDASGSVDVELEDGDYLINAYIFAPTPEMDAFYIVANDQYVQRTFTRLHGQFTYGAKVLAFTAQAGVYNIKVSSNWPDTAPGETGMIIDRLEIVSGANAADAVRRWQQ